MGSLDAALGEAVYMMGIENNSDIVTMASYAPIFANLNNRMWAPDMIQYTSDKVFGTPSYYVQNVMANNIVPRDFRIIDTVKHIGAKTVETRHVPFCHFKDEIKHPFCVF